MARVSGNFQRTQLQRPFAMPDAARWRPQRETPAWLRPWAPRATDLLVLAIVALCVGAAVFGPWLLSGGLLERPWAAVMTAATLPPVILWIRGKKS